MSTHVLYMGTRRNDAENASASAQFKCMVIAL